MIVDALSVEVRVTVLGHLQRGGQPTPRDRWLATRFGSAAVHLVEQEQWGQMVALHGDEMVAVPMSAAAQIKMVDPDGEMVQMARDLGHRVWVRPLTPDPSPTQPLRLGGEGEKKA